jgi:alkyl hydroperoxide reductase subunit D
MGMNTVYYRFRHLVGKESYGQKPARLRMQAMVKPQTTKANFELFSMAIAVLAGCETCIKAHEASILQHGLGDEHVHDAVRIAAILSGAAVALRTQAAG